jgi:DNA-binding MarR family transcriptional regulator
MRQIKLSGREQAVIRNIDYASGSSGQEIQERTQIDGSDLADILNGLCDVGYVETFPATERINYLNYAALRFEVNPSYALELKTAMRRS